MEYQKNGGHGGINDEGRLDTVSLNAKTTQPQPLSVPFDFHGRYDSYIQLKSDRLLGHAANAATSNAFRRMIYLSGTHYESIEILMPLAQVA